MATTILLGTHGAVITYQGAFPGIGTTGRSSTGDDPRNPGGRNPSQSGCVPPRSTSPPAAFLGLEGLPHQRFSAPTPTFETWRRGVFAAEERGWSSCQ